MRAPSSKDKIPTHFFKFIRPGSNGQLNLPERFAVHLKNRKKNEMAVLKRGCRKWVVEVVDHKIFGQGWEVFVRENGVEDFDFVVFKHQGNMVFNTIVFDPSCCERDIPTNQLTQIKAEETCPKENSLYKVSGLSKEKKAPQNRYFKSTVTAHSIKKSLVNVPLEFAKSNGLNNRKCEMIVMDQQQRRWSTQLRRWPRNVVIIGFQEIQAANDLKEGDEFLLELVKNGNKPVMKFYKTGKNVIQGDAEVEEVGDLNTKSKRVKFDSQDKKYDSDLINKSIRKAEETRIPVHSPHPYFIGTLTSANSKYRMYMPKEFALSNGLNDGEIILKDVENKGLWSTMLDNYQGKMFHLHHGWHEFWVANGLKAGDTFKFELIQNGEKRVAVVSRISEGTPMPTGKTVQNPCFKPILTPDRIKHSFVNVPMGFARSNGLDDRNCEMEVMDEKQRRWPMRLRKVTNHVQIRGGFRELQVANDLKEGDEFLLELVDNGNKPLMNFHSNNLLSPF